MKTKAKIALCRMLKSHPQMIGNEIIVNGDSMFPTLVDGEKVKVDPSAKDVKVGDIVLYQQFPTHLTIHRIVKKISQNGSIFYVTKGDNNDQCDCCLLDNDRIIGKIIGN